LIVGSKTAEKNSTQTNRQTDKQTDRQTDRHYENNGHLAVNQYNSAPEYHYNCSVHCYSIHKRTMGC